MSNEVKELSFGMLPVTKGILVKLTNNDTGESVNLSIAGSWKLFVLTKTDEAKSRILSLPLTDPQIQLYKDILDSFVGHRVEVIDLSADSVLGIGKLEVSDTGRFGIAPDNE